MRSGRRQSRGTEELVEQLLRGHEEAVNIIVVRARIGDVEAPRVDVVHVVGVLLVRIDELPSAVFSEHRHERAPRRVCVGTLEYDSIDGSFAFLDGMLTLSVV